MLARLAAPIPAGQTPGLQPANHCAAAPAPTTAAMVGGSVFERCARCDGGRAFWRNAAVLEWRQQPSWFAETLVRERLGRLVRGPISDWGVFAFDPRRREALNLAADELVRDIDGLTTTIRALQEMPSDPDVAGAVETLFAAVGRALLVPEGVRLVQIASELHALWQKQMAVAVQRYLDHVPMPASWSSSDPALTHSWFVVCWEWSFVLPPPPGVVPAAATWLFPGWTRPHLETLPRELRVWAEHEPQRWVRFAEMCRRNLKQKPPSGGVELDEWAAWAWAQLDAGRQLDLPTQHRINWSLLARMLLHPAFSNDPRRAQLAEAVLQHALNAGDANRPLWILNAQPNELEVLFNEFGSLDLLTVALDRAQISAQDVVLELARRLPEPYRLAAVEWALRRKPDLAEHPHFPVTDLDHLPEEAIAALATAPRAASRLAETWYRRAPQSAFDWLINGHLADRAAEGVLASLSERHLTALLSRVGPERLPNAQLWAANWLGRHPALVRQLWPWLRHPAVVRES